MRVQDVCDQFFESMEFLRLAPATQQYYGYGVTDMPAELRRMALSRLKPADVRAFRALDYSAAKIERCLATFRRIEGWAIAMDLMEKQVSAGIHAPCHSTPHRAWTVEELSAFDAIDPSPVKALFIFAYYTAQRKSDLFAATWDQVVGETWHLQQKKTKRPLIIPFPEAVQAALAPPAMRTGPILADRYGAPLTPGAMTHQWNKTLKGLGLTGCTLHGLRVTRAVHLAEAGCSIHEIAAVTGHRSLRMVQHYTRDANQPNLAQHALTKVAKADLPYQPLAG